MVNKKNEITIRSSAAEYLTYVAALGDNPEAIEVRYEDENIWLTQKMLATLYGVTTSAINQHIKTIYEDNELNEDSTIKNFLIVQKEGNREVSRNVAHYNLQIIYNRADHKKENMGLTSWEGSPDSKIHKYDVIIAKNYLSEKEIAQLERMVSAYLDLAEMQAMRHIPMTMADWEERLNGLLKLWDHEILKDNGKISAEMAKIHAETEFEKYRIIQDQIYISDFDELLLNTKKLEKKDSK